MRQLIIASVIALNAFSATAQAADLSHGARQVQPLYAAPSWTGMYVGVVGGYGWMGGQSATIDSGLGGVTANASPSGGLAGLTLGYSMQFDRVVASIEGDLSLGDVIGSGSSNTVGLFGIPISGGVRTALTDLYTIRGRIGYLITPKTQIYATGGFAGAKSTIDGSVSIFGSQVTTSETQSLHGWTIGGGVEMLVYGNMSLKAEALYAALNDSKITVPNLFGTSTDVSVPNKLTVGRLGVNWKF